MYCAGVQPDEVTFVLCKSVDWDFEVIELIQDWPPRTLEEEEEEGWGGWGRGEEREKIKERIQGVDLIITQKKRTTTCSWFVFYLPTRKLTLCLQKMSGGGGRGGIAHQNCIKYTQIHVYGVDQFEVTYIVHADTILAHTSLLPTIYSTNLQNL